MNIVPIVFCFDDNLELPAGVCITSLLEHAHSDTFYDIFILHADGCQYPYNGKLDKLVSKYPNCHITYRSVGNEFDAGFEIRSITKAAYYRLLIPEIIPEYDKIMYHDVDVIFRSDLSIIYHETDLAGCYIAGVISPGFLNPKVVQCRLDLGLNPEDYILSGNLIFNSALLRADGMVEKFRKQAENDYIHQDMDVINIVCKGKLKRLPTTFCGTIEIFSCAIYSTPQKVYSEIELSDMLKHGIIHYNGPKPWNQYCPNFDIWWEYYRRSIYYDPKFYFDFFYSKLHAYDSLTLMQRIKLVFRYFKTKGLRKLEIADEYK